MCYFLPLILIDILADISGSSLFRTYEDLDNMSLFRTSWKRSFHLSITLIFYKNILDRFWEKIKNFCKIIFSLKVLKAKIRYKNIVCYIGKIKNFSSENSQISERETKFFALKFVFSPFKYKS